MKVEDEDDISSLEDYHLVSLVFDADVGLWQKETEKPKIKMGSSDLYSNVVLYISN